jgi:hypothetical protein
MIKIKIILISLMFLLANCGFSPIYVKNTNNNFSIENVIYNGDKELNNFLKTNLNQYKNEEANKKVDIEAISEYEKIILTKNKAGKVTNYKLIAKVTFLIKSTDRKINIIEERVINTMDDKFEEAKKEKAVKQSFATSISSKLASELIIN